MNNVKVIDWKSKHEFKLARIGEGNWIKWLVNYGYDIIDQVDLGQTEINLYKSETLGLYAIYCPYFINLDTERLFIDIPTEEEARLFIAAIKKMLEPML
ncbi:hypothetical protein [Calothrix sp. PCC 6303]|uniref:hypothetical protein n=1 Tax=Calothrix sp. PCC 6303 TaxID=1170562 RepID=UPI0002A00B9E|nr:hypothetical protein [Calothrix sp. PCC 6303]AFZ03830.1 hypothetical protein Cal6303_4933 [Calothrix sp. PCC 6303]